MEANQKSRVKLFGVYMLQAIGICVYNTDNSEQFQILGLKKKKDYTTT